MLRTFGVPILKGREFDDADTVRMRYVVVPMRI
jgi:hypothetical protein